MILDLILLVAGLVLGFAICSEKAQHKEQKTFEQVDEEVRKELSRLHNLTDSLKTDVTYLRKKLAAAHDQIRELKKNDTGS